MKQSRDGSGPRIDAGDVRSLEAIVIKATERQIAGDGFAAMFPGNNVIDLERKK